ncbi:MAG: pyrroloquinoline quinone precursor peptide PqqA [Sphingomonadales bacterium]|nr:pyrroloquinoline quinone precursor peptide PqqA [Sphingomonadales bacterium]MDE2169291.1 pyrroloquinoline quinone precursor peptide PqqA [Sphingomonadales bacterium]
MRGLGVACVVGPKDHCLKCPLRLKPVRETDNVRSPEAPGRRRKKERSMAWKTPKIVEIALGCEINCYACAEIKA